MTEASSLGFDTCAAHAIIKVMNIYSVSKKCPKFDCKHDF